MKNKVNHEDKAQTETVESIYLTIQESAKYAGVSVRTIKMWLNQGLVHSKVSTKIVRIKKEWLDEFFEKHIQQRHVVKQLVDSVVDQIKGAA